MATGPDQKNPSRGGNNTESEEQKTPFAQSLIERVMNLFEEARQAGNAANQARYEKILRGYDQLTNE